MLQSLSDLKGIAQKLNKILSQPFPIQKIQSTPTTTCIRFRTQGKTLFLHIGRGRGVEGIWLSEAAPKKEVRIRDRYHEYLQKNLIGCAIFSIEYDDKYRIFKIELKKRDYQNTFFFYYKGRLLYFANIDRSHEPFLFKSWIGKKESVDREHNFDFNEIFGDLYSGPVPKTESNKEFSLVEHYDSLISVKTKPKKAKLLKKKIKELSEKLILIESSRELQLRVPILGETDLINEMQKLGIRIRAVRNESIYQFRNRVFTKIKNFKRSKDFTELKIENLNSDLKNLKPEQVLKKINLPVWREIQKEKNKNNIQKFSYKSIQAAVGKNVKGNDFLRNKYGDSEDTWFHIEGEKSCHLVVKEKLENIDRELLDIIGSIIRDYSKKNSLEIRLLASILSEVKGVKGRAGAVTLKNPFYFKVLYNPSWKEIISLD